MTPYQQKKEKKINKINKKPNDNEKNIIKFYITDFLKIIALTNNYKYY